MSGQALTSVCRPSITRGPGLRLTAPATNCRLAPPPDASSHDLPKIALLIETSRGFGREMLKGIARYAQLHGPWSFHITAGDYTQVVPKMKQWGGAGIIARIPNEQVARAILATGLPTIALGLTDEQMRPESPLSAFSEL